MSEFLFPVSPTPRTKPTRPKADQFSSGESRPTWVSVQVFGSGAKHRTGAIPAGIPHSGAMKSIKINAPLLRDLHQLTLDEYREALAPGGSPSDEQIEEFVHYVANAHSWYKHLPAFPPGAPFWFFLDPGAGYETQLDASGIVSYHERTAARGFHYNYRPTAVWRSEFGALQWKCNQGTAFIVGGTGEFTTRPYDGPVILHPEFGPCRLPPEVEAEGFTRLTAAMHEYSFQCLLFDWIAFESDLPPPLKADWPDEYGGNELRDRIVGVEFKEQIELLKLPAHSQYERMRWTIHAVRRLVFPNAV